MAITISVNIFYIVVSRGCPPNPYPQYYPPQLYPPSNPPFHQQTYPNPYAPQFNPYAYQTNTNPANSSQTNPNLAFAPQPNRHALHLNPNTANFPVPAPYVKLGRNDTYTDCCIVFCNYAKNNIMVSTIYFTS